MDRPQQVAAMRRQASDELAAAIGIYTELTNAQPTQLYAHVRSIAVYAAHGLLAESEVRARFFDAARANGTLQKYGAPWATKAIRCALNCAADDPLPPLHPEYRSEAASA